MKKFAFILASLFILGSTAYASEAAKAPAKPASAAKAPAKPASAPAKAPAKEAPAKEAKK